MNKLFYIVFQILCTVTSLGSFILCIARIKWRYSYREIEEIVIYDRSQKSKLDQDSPAILLVYFEELRRYEQEKYFYRVDV